MILDALLLMIRVDKFQQSRTNSAYLVPGAQQNKSFLKLLILPLGMRPWA